MFPRSRLWIVSHRKFRMFAFVSGYHPDRLGESRRPLSMLAVVERAMENERGDLETRQNH